MKKHFLFAGALAILVLWIRTYPTSTQIALETGHAQEDSLPSASIPAESATSLSRSTKPLPSTIPDSNLRQNESAPANIGSDIPNAKWPVRFWGLLLDENGTPIRTTKCSADLTVGSNEFGTAFTTSTEGLFDFVFTFPNPIEVIDTIEVAIFSEGLGAPNGMGGWRVVDPPRSAILSRVLVPFSQEVPLGPMDLGRAFVGLSGLASVSASFFL